MADSRKKGNKQAEAQEQESGKFYLLGTITTAMYGKRTFANGKKDKEEKYRVSLKCTAETIEKLKDTAEPFYVDTDEKYLPDWLTKDTPEDGGYINLASSFPFRVGEYVNGAIVDKGELPEYLEANGGNINGSTAIVLVTIKPGALYPAALLIKELKKQDIGSMFAGSEFTEAFGEELPFT